MNNFKNTTIIYLVFWKYYEKYLLFSWFNFKVTWVCSKNVFRNEIKKLTDFKFSPTKNGLAAAMKEYPFCFQ